MATFNQIFGNNAKWTEYEKKDGLPLIRKQFSVKNLKKATLTATGLGFFEVFINGKRVSDDFLKPAFSDYFHRSFKKLNYPLKDVTSHRIYAVRYDVSDYLVEGENVIAFIIGEGWLGQREKVNEGNVSFSDKLFLAFNLVLEDKKGNRKEVYSDQDLKVKPSHIIKSNMYHGEVADFGRYKINDYLAGEEKGFSYAKVITPPDVPFFIQECPSDTVTEIIAPQKLADLGNDTALYDAGKNVTGFVSVRGSGRVIITCSENINGNILDFDSCGGKISIQKEEYYNLTEDITTEVYFRWSGFRYFTVEGNVKEVVVKMMNIPFERVATFDSDNDTLNWLAETYVRTQLENMHSGIPSDCPHRERLGYTGDGQLTTESALLMLDADKFYRKWFEDIKDCQDIRTGHVQHTAPLMGGGGGPIGWDGAILLSPYYHHKLFGDDEYYISFLPYIKRWIEFTINNCMGTLINKNLIVRECKGGWCLGDWCTLTKIKIPAPYVNTCLFVKCLEYYDELCKLANVENEFSGRAELCKKAIVKKYRNKNTGRFCNSLQGAEYFAADINLISDAQILEYVQETAKNGYVDTGIIGTEILFKVMCERGYIDEACELLTSEKPGSFGYMKKCGATTLWEYWDGVKSQNHPMFGASVKYLFTGIAGIHYFDGFKKVEIVPYLPKQLNRLNVTLTRPNVKISVNYQRIDGKLAYKVKYDGDSDVTVKLEGKTYTLKPSEEATF